METWVLFKNQQFELINNKYNEIDEKIEVLLEKREEYDQQLEESGELNNLREEYEKIDEKIQVLLEERSEYEEQSEELDDLSQENYDNKKNVINANSVYPTQDEVNVINTNSEYPTRGGVRLIDTDLIILLMRIIGDKIYTVTSQQNYLYLLFVQYNLLILFYPYFTLSFSLLLIAFILRFIEFITLKLRNDYIDDKLKDYIKIHYPNYYKIKQN